MREIRPSGSEGGAGFIPAPTPIVRKHRQLADNGSFWVGLSAMLRPVLPVLAAGSVRLLVGAQTAGYQNLVTAW